MSQLTFTNSGLLPQIKGYRIIQNARNQFQQDVSNDFTIKIYVQNKNNGIPKIRHDVICQGKLYPLIPLFSFTNENDLKITEQISAIVIKDENEILCQILSNIVKEVKSSQYIEVKQKMKSVFGLDLKIDSQDLFLIVISDQIKSQKELNFIFDSLSQTQFVNLIKQIFENCAYKVIPKILRKLNKYFNSSKQRQKNSLERLKRYLKIVKLANDNEIQNDGQQKLQSKQQEKQQQEKKGNKQKQIIKKEQVENKPIQKLQNITKNQKAQKVQQKKTKNQLQQPKLKQKESKKSQKIVNSSLQSQKIRKGQQTKSNGKKSSTIRQVAKEHQQEEEWHDVEQQSDNEELQDKIHDMALNPDSQDYDFNFKGAKHNIKHKKSNVIIPLDPQFDNNVGRRDQRLKQKKNNKNNYQSNNEKNDSNKNRKPQNLKQNFDDAQNNKTNNNRQNRYRNGNSQQSKQRGGRRQFSKQNKRIDQRILLGLNGANDSVWRQKMRPPHFPKNQSQNISPKRNDYFKEKRGPKDAQQISKNQTGNQKDTLIVSKIAQKKDTSDSAKQNVAPKNLKLQRIFSIPEDSQKGKVFKFENRNYNLFVNKLFWVNVSQNQITIQKDGKGYIRKSPVEIIDQGRGIMAEGLTLNIDGISNLQDGGTPFGDPVFQQFTPQGQWFHVNSLQVYAYN